MSTDEVALFTDEQRTRARALDAARAVLVQRGAFNSSAVSSVVDLITVAQWIIDGRDPWPPDEDEKSNPDEITIRDAHGSVVRTIRDSRSDEDSLIRDDLDLESRVEVMFGGELGGEPTDQGVEADR